MRFVKYLQLSLHLAKEQPVPHQVCRYAVGLHDVLHVHITGVLPGVAYRRHTQLLHGRLETIQLVSRHVPKLFADGHIGTSVRNHQINSNKLYCV